ncbi:MAG: histidine--tRNA ligase, partial [Treponema sp.]|nr:histidine--tRNA ligase [Treponema sp.]
IGQQVPAVGFSIGFERICSILLDQKYQIPGAKEKCAFLYDDSISFVQVMAEAEKLRESFNVSVLKKAKKPGPQFDMLEKQGYTKFAQIKDGSIVVK